VPDNFALLNEPRRPWLDPEALKQKFRALASDAHPDRVPNANESEKAAVTRRYAELNAAFNCLAEPKSRLLHLLELELGAKPKDIERIPAGLADLFAAVANLCREADVFLAEKNQATSPLVQVRLFERGQGWVGRLNELQKKLDDLRGQLTDELKSLDEKWTANSPDLPGENLRKLEELYRLFGYFNRWNGQVQERVVRLSF